jgi:carboxypeptidase Q
VYRRLSLFAALFALAATPAAAQFGPPPSGFVVENPVLRRIWAMGMDSSHTVWLSQTLFDSLGPRLTGSPGMEAAQDWAVKTYQSWGIDAKKEQYGTWRGWRRGVTHIDLVAPRVRSLEGQMVAWSPGTPKGKPVRAPAILLPEVADSNALIAWLPQAKGKFVLVSFPQPTCRPDTSWAHWATPAAFDSMKARRTVAQQAWNDRIAHTGYEFRYGHYSLLRRLEAAGVAGFITNYWSQGWGVDKIFDTQVDHTPTVDISCEDYGLVARLTEHRQGPVIELEAESQARGEVPVFNVVAQIKGTELPNEYVMLSAHFDSWDGGSGATDNGTGTIMAMEAMRILSQVYPHPRRTILVGDWSGEEEGLLGSKGFVADHPQIVDSLQALFNQDNGTGRVESMSASGYPQASGNLARYLSQIPADLTRDIKFSFPGTPGGGGTDHASFVMCGAPGFGLGSGQWDYGQYTWHTNRDTYDKISFDDLKQNATLVAMLVYLASEDPQVMSRQKRDVFPMGRDGKPMAWPACTPPDRSTPPAK